MYVFLLESTLEGEEKKTKVLKIIKSTKSRSVHPDITAVCQETALTFELKHFFFFLTHRQTEKKAKVSLL